MGTFADQIKALTPADEDVRRLAERAGVPMSTVRRWATGAAVPHPRIQKMIFELVEKGPIG